MLEGPSGNGKPGKGGGKGPTKGNGNSGHGHGHSAPGVGHSAPGRGGKDREAILRLHRALNRGAGGDKLHPNMMRKKVIRSIRAGKFTDKDLKALQRLYSDVKDTPLKSLSDDLGALVVRAQSAKDGPNSMASGSPANQTGGGNNGDGNNGGKGNGGKGNGGKGKGKGKDKGKDKGGGGLSFGGVEYGGPGDWAGNTRGLRREAKSLVQGDINSQLRAVLRAMQEARGQYKYDRRTIKTDAKRARGDLNYVWGEVEDYMKGQNKEQNQQYRDTEQELKDIYGQQAQGLAAGTKEGADAISAEQARLGLVGDMGNFTGDSAFNAAQAGGSKQDALGNLATQKSAADSIMAMLGGAAQGEHLSQMGRVQNEILDQKGDLRQDYNQLFGDLRQQAQDIRAGKGAAMQEMLMALEERDYSRFMEAWQQNFMNQMSVNQFNLEKQGMKASNRLAAAPLKQEEAYQKWLRKQNKRGSRDAKNIGNQLQDMFSGLFG